MFHRHYPKTDFTISLTKRLRINMDFYKSEHFYYTFLEIPSNKVSDYEARALLSGLLDGNTIDNQTYLELSNLTISLFQQMRLNQTKIDQLLNLNISNYSQFLNELSKSKDLKNIEETFIKIKDILKQILGQLEKNSEAPLDTIGPISKILISLNILDLNLWKVVVQTTFLYPERFQSNVQLANTLESITLLLKKFNFKDDSENSFTRHHFYFNETELTSLLNKRIILSFYSKFDTYFVTNESKLSKDQSSCCNILTLASEIINRFSKVSYVSNPDERKYFKKFEKMIFESFDTLTPKNTLSLFSSMVSIGLNTPDVVQKFHSHLLKADHFFDDDSNLDRLLQIWKKIGKYDETLYNHSVRKALSNFIADQKNAYKLPTIAFSLAMIKLPDQDLWKQLLDRCNQLDIGNLFFFHKKSLHLVFQMLKVENFLDLDLSKYTEMRNYLSKFCIGVRYGYDFTKVKLPHLEKEPIDCCKASTIEEYNKAFQAIYKGHSQKSLSVNEQKNPTTIQEKIIREAVRKYFPQFLGKEIKFSDEHPHCLYRIDFACSIPGVHDKIALEITGASYTFESGEMVGKKQFKFKMLESDGWLPVIIHIGTTIPHNILGIASENTEKTIAKYAYQALSQEVKSRLNIQLPFNDQSKWKKKLIDVEISNSKKDEEIITFTPIKTNSNKPQQNNKKIVAQTKFEL